MKNNMLVTALIALSCGLTIGCGGASKSGGLSATDATNFATAVAAAATNAAAGGMSGQDVTPHMLKHMSARLLNRSLNAGAPKVAPRLLSVQCTPDGTSCTFSDNFNVSEACQTGGSMSVAGSLNGTGTANSAYISMEMEVTPNSWTCDGPTINGAPYVQINGTFDYPANTLTMTMSGAFTAGGQTCQLNVTVNGNADGSGDISGTACGNSVYGSF